MTDSVRSEGRKVNFAMVYEDGKKVEFNDGTYKGFEGYTVGYISGKKKGLDGKVTPFTIEADSKRFKLIKFLYY